MPAEAGAGAAFGTDLGLVAVFIKEFVSRHKKTANWRVLFFVDLKIFLSWLFKGFVCGDYLDNRFFWFAFYKTVAERFIVFLRADPYGSPTCRIDGPSVFSKFSSHICVHLGSVAPVIGGEFRDLDLGGWNCGWLVFLQVIFLDKLCYNAS